jgi:N utilization substance protein B
LPKAFHISGEACNLRSQKTFFNMLNRRTIRIKIMQNLFAYNQCRDANLLLAHDLIEERFQPNLNSMEVQDKELLRSQRKSALQLFDKKMKGENVKSDSTTVYKAVDDAIHLFQKSIKKDQSHLGKSILLEMERLAATYHSIITLILALADQAAADKKTDHGNFVKNSLIKAWKQNEELKKAVLKENSGWEGRMDKVRGWFRDILKEEPNFKKYNSEENPNEEAQKNFIKHLSRKVILGPGIINDYFEEQNINWAEDKDIVKSMMDKTIKSYVDGTITLQKVSLNWDDDREFIDRLFNNAIDLDPKYKELIAKNTRNWEVDRLPLTDRVILEMAISEMIHFPNIPIKVTINEYIELSKEYSTPKSRQFINGILDVISKAMKESGDLKKSGRGLIDNK